MASWGEKKDFGIVLCRRCGAQMEPTDIFVKDDSRQFYGMDVVVPGYRCSVCGRVENLSGREIKNGDAQCDLI